MIPFYEGSLQLFVWEYKYNLRITFSSSLGRIDKEEIF